MLNSMCDSLINLKDFWIIIYVSYDHKSSYICIFFSFIITEIMNEYEKFNKLSSEKSKSNNTICSSFLLIISYSYTFKNSTQFKVD